MGDAFLGSHDDWFTPARRSPFTADRPRRPPIAELVRAVAVAESQPDVLRRLNELLALAHPRPYATDHDGELHLHYARPDAPVLEQLTTTVAMGLAQVVVAARVAAAGRLLGRGLRRRLRRHLAQRQPPLLLQHLRQPLDRRRLPRPQKRA